MSTADSQTTRARDGDASRGKATAGHSLVGLSSVPGLRVIPASSPVVSLRHDSASPGRHRAA